jgi:Anaphase-promoting complex, subunit 10 (APC10)
MATQAQAQAAQAAAAAVGAIGGGAPTGAPAAAAVATIPTNAPFLHTGVFGCRGEGFEWLIGILLAGFAQPPVLPWPDISDRAKWSVSSYKFGFGVECLRDGDPDTFWQ